jgi:RNA polymerase-binding transcription factor DksA
VNIGERQIERAEANVRREAERSIARIREELAEEGEDFCVVCDEPIEAARKAVLPSADRCVECQAHHELRRKREARGY